jgi:hypothetical protein
VDEERHPIGASHGFETGEALYGYAFPTGPRVNPVAPPANGFDYIELGCDRSSSASVPDSFGGVSGGGVWKVEIDSPDGSAGSEILGEVILCGVAFYQGDIDTQ